jgi:molybdate transport system substrate-binding protein
VTRRSHEKPSCSGGGLEREGGPARDVGRRARILQAGVALLALCAALAGCGSSGDPELKVSAASSLTKAFNEYAPTLENVKVRYSFAGSDELAAQIEEGVRPDVFASANTKLPATLYAKHLVEAPAVFAGNKLVLAVPSGSDIHSVAGLEKPGTTIAVGSATVPVGTYTETVLGRLSPSQRLKITKNIRDREPNVSGIVGKLSEGAVDAGFLYATDVKAAGGKIEAIDLPASLQPDVAYGIAVVRGTPHAEQARAFVSGLLHGSGQSELQKAGFLPPPSSG